ncbi:hypothetical protein NC651_000708 [Populus alba x Populus x berolinensis]|nr:hypothetical protein NC651_000708 [Populus alba x Populus x berolinensis]
MSDGTFSSHICGEVVVVGSPSATVFGRITAESEKHTALARRDHN